MGDRVLNLQIDAIPDIHFRRCKKCGTSIFLTSEISVLVKKGVFIETWISECKNCGNEITYTIPSDSHEPTKEDVTLYGECLEGLKSLLKPRQRKDKSGIEPDTNG